METLSTALGAQTGSPQPARPENAGREGAEGSLAALGLRGLPPSALPSWPLAPARGCPQGGWPGQRPPPTGQAGRPLSLGPAAAPLPLSPAAPAGWEGRTRLPASRATRGRPGHSLNTSRGSLWTQAQSPLSPPHLKATRQGTAPATPARVVPEYLGARQAGAPRWTAAHRTPPVPRPPDGAVSLYRWDTQAQGWVSAQVTPGPWGTLSPPRVPPRPCPPALPLHYPDPAHLRPLRYQGSVLSTADAPVLAWPASR